MSAKCHERTFVRCGVGEGIMSKQLGSPLPLGAFTAWVKNPKAPALTREAEDGWGTALLRGAV
jgi:hypothetical protein